MTFVAFSVRHLWLIVDICGSNISTFVVKMTFVNCGAVADSKPSPSVNLPKQMASSLLVINTTDNLTKNSWARWIRELNRFVQQSK